jgi:YidC/Oxa1 family membrane protein insertase
MIRIATSSYSRRYGFKGANEALGLNAYRPNCQWAPNEASKDNDRKDAVASAPPANLFRLRPNLGLGRYAALDCTGNGIISTIKRRQFSTSNAVMKEDEFPSETQHFSSTDLDSVNESLLNIDAMSGITSPATDSAATAALDLVVEPLSNEFVRTGYPTDYCIDAIMKLDEITGFGYATSICMITLGVRTLMFPLFVKSQRTQSRMAHLMPELDMIKARVEKANDTETKLKLQQQVKALFKRYDVNPFSNLGLLAVQMPLFMSMFFALQRMPELFPQHLANESFMWCTDLGAPDPMYGLPLLTAASFAGMVEASKKQMSASSGAQGEMMVKVMRGLAFVMVPFTAYFPVIMFTYWLPNNLFSFGQSLLFAQPEAKKALGIWEPPKPVPGAPKPPSPFDQLSKSFGLSSSDGDKKPKSFMESFKDMQQNAKAQAKADAAGNMSAMDDPTEAEDKRQLRMSKIRGAKPLGALKKSRNNRRR